MLPPPPGSAPVQSLDLVVDKKVVDEVVFDDIPFILLAAFFVYNICFPNGRTFVCLLRDCSAKVYI